MKTYFITSDIHSFYTIFIEELLAKGFDPNNKDHILIICGDAFDRGNEANLLLDFLYDMHNQRRLIYIKGNHEDLLEDCLFQIEARVNISQHHWLNGTLDTVSQVSEINKYDIVCGVYDYKKDIEPKFKKYFELMKCALNYYEIKDYIFVHGWIPHIRNYENLKKCSADEWSYARWSNGISDWKSGWYYKDKTIVCGHWHVVEFNKNLHNTGSGKFDNKGDFLPFIDNGIIALDATTAFSKQINVIIINESGELLNDGRSQIK